jgi:(1->4)-alpha-D-glucan 1-alpha-D-glucosylmutase
VDYLHAIGISDCYASSYLKAVPGSPHGYDVADPTRINPEIGSQDDYDGWVHALANFGMGHIVDVIPNHMGIARGSNAWWLDVLEHGPSSAFARFFDIDWRPVKAELADKVLLPVLDGHYGDILERQELELVCCQGAFAVRYHDEWFPIAPDTFGPILRRTIDEAAGVEPAAEDVTALRGLIDRCERLPARTTRDHVASATRRRESQEIKEQLTSLTTASAGVRDAVGAAVRWFNGRRNDPRSFDALDALLSQQSYRLADWRVASDEINYRRFFDVNQLAALRVEDPEVFDVVHAHVLELVSRKHATGLRVDHVDGLFSPVEYLRRLQGRAADALGLAAGRDCPMYVVVEKILGHDEELSPDWPVHGTTGYEFLARANGLFVDTRNERAFEDIYARFVAGRSPSFDDLTYQSKRLVMHEVMSGDVNALGRRLERYCEADRHLRDFTLYTLISAIKEIIASYPVYRTYIGPGEPPSAQDRRHVTVAAGRARRRAPAVTRSVIDFVERLLLKEGAGDADTDARRIERDRFIGKFQQTTGPISAKGIEDTAMYSFNRLLSLNEVGSDPTRFGIEPLAVHQWLAARGKRWPNALSATSTHDTKRGEDVRARLNVLSEVPGAWKAELAKWRVINRRAKRVVRGALAPSANEEYLIYQSLVGAWPFDAQSEGAFADRFQAYVVKALREAKTNTSWFSPDQEYEAAVRHFVAMLLDPGRPFLDSFRPFQARIADLGIYNSLAQLLVKITAPGIPDFYQGTELWDLSLVDPDNRRPVDYATRRRLAETIAAAGDDPATAAVLLDERPNGRVKLFVMMKALAARASLRPTFELGDYVALDTAGARRGNVFAFARRHEDALALTCVPRLVAELRPDAAGPPTGRSVWGDTRIVLPHGVSGVFRDVFTGAVCTVADNETAIEVATLLDRFPIALLVPDDSRRPNAC